MVRKLKRAQKPKKRRRLSRNSICIHRNYTVEEAARALGVHRQTVLRWIRNGLLPAIMDQKPWLILGSDLVDFIASRAKPKPKLPLHQFRCFRCRLPKSPAFAAVEYHVKNSLTGDLMALCEVCGTEMHKAFSARNLDALRAVVEVTIVQADERLMDCKHPPSNAHLQQEPKTHA